MTEGDAKAANLPLSAAAVVAGSDQASPVLAAPAAPDLSSATERTQETLATVAPPVIGLTAASAGAAASAAASAATDGPAPALAAATSDLHRKSFVSTFSSLQYYNYRLWFFGAFVSNIGTWVQRVGQDWLVMAILTHGAADSGLQGGIVTALQFFPVLVLSTYGGLLADRMNRRKLLMLTQGSMGLLALGLGLITLSGHVTIWAVYAFALLLGAVTAIDSPVRQTFVGEMVPPGHLANAVGLNSTSFNAARLIGPAVGGFLIAGVGPGWSFIANGLSFVATTCSLLFMRPAELRELPTAPRKKGQIREGLRYVRGRTDIIIILIVVGVVSCLGLNNQLTQAQMAIRVFHKSASEYGILGSIFAIGSLLGALLASRREHPRVRLVVGAAMAFGIVSGVYCLMPTYESFAIAGLFVGLCTLTIITSANATVQLGTEPAMRGRVMSIYMMIFMGVTPVGSILVGWVAGLGTTGPRWAIAIGSIASILVAGWAMIWTRRHWGVRIHVEHVFPPRIDVEKPAHAGEEGMGR